MTTAEIKPELFARVFLDVCSDKLLDVSTEGFSLQPLEDIGICGLVEIQFLLDDGPGFVFGRCLLLSFSHHF